MPKLMYPKIQIEPQSVDAAPPCIPLLSAAGFSAYFTYRGGICNAESPYAGFNVCHYTGDSPEHISHCRALLCGHLGVEEEALVVPRQTHSTNVAVIDNIPFDNRTFEGVDALVTTLDNVVIGVSTADCVPVVLGDIDSGVIGVAHAGWRGAVGGIMGNTVSAMVSVGADASKIKAALGPSICVDCFEVGEEVAAQFPDGCVERRSGWRKPHVNLQRFVTDELVYAGLERCNISPFSKERCTLCHPATFFSARSLGVNSGRLFTFVKRY